MPSTNSLPSANSHEDLTEILLQKINRICQTSRSATNSHSKPRPTPSLTLPSDPAHVRMENRQTQTSQTHRIVPMGNRKSQRKNPGLSRGSSSDTRRPKVQGVLYIPPPFGKAGILRTTPIASQKSSGPESSDPELSTFDETIEKRKMPTTSATVEEPEDDHRPPMAETRALYDPTSRSQSSISDIPYIVADESGENIFEPLTSGFNSDALESKLLPSWLIKWASEGDDFCPGHFADIWENQLQGPNQRSTFEELSYAFPAERGLSRVDWEELKMLFPEVSLN